MRRVHSVELSTPSEREVALTRSFEAPRSLVYEAWTRCEHVKRWMLGPEGWTMPICEIDLRPGGASRFVWRKPGGSEMEIRGTYREIDPPEKLVSSESWGAEWPETVNTLVLTEADGRTTAVLTISYPSQEARDAAIQTGMSEGLEQGYARLDGYLTSMA